MTVAVRLLHVPRGSVHSGALREGAIEGGDDEKQGSLGFRVRVTAESDRWTTAVTQGSREDCSKETVRKIRVRPVKKMAFIKDTGKGVKGV